MADYREKQDADVVRPEEKNMDGFFRLNGFRQREQISASVELIRIVFCILVIGLVIAGLIFVFR